MAKGTQSTEENNIRAFQVPDMGNRSNRSQLQKQFNQTRAGDVEERKSLLQWFFPP
jgi:hypothetical protein